MLNTTETTAYPNHMIPREKYSLPLTIVCILFGILILIGNAMVCYIYHVTPSLRTIANKLMISCSASAICVALLFVPFYVVFDDMTKSVSSHAMPISSFLSSFLGFATLFNIGALTIERYISIFYGLRYEQIMTKGMVKFMLFTAWFIPFLLSILPFIISLSLQNKKEIIRAFKIYQGFLSTILLVTMTSIFAVYVRFWLASRSHLNFAKQQRNHVTSLQSAYADACETNFISIYTSGDEEETEKLTTRQLNPIAKKYTKHTMKNIFMLRALYCLSKQRKTSLDILKVQENKKKVSLPSKRKNGSVNSTYIQQNCQGINVIDSCNNGNRSANESNNSKLWQESSPTWDYGLASEYTPSTGTPGSLTTPSEYQTKSIFSESFTKDLTRRLSTLSSNMKADEKKRRTSQLSITINDEKLFDNSTIHSSKPNLFRKISRSNFVQSPRKLSVDWTPRRAINATARKFSVPSNVYSPRDNSPFKVTPQTNRRRISVGSNVYNSVMKELSSRDYKNGELQCGGHPVVDHHKEIKTKTKSNISPILSIDDASMSESNNIRREDLMTNVRSEKKKRESNISYPSNVSKLSDLRVSFSVDATPCTTPLLECSSSQSRVFFSLNTSPTGLASPRSQHKKVVGQIKGIMRNSPTVSINQFAGRDQNKVTLKRTHSARTYSRRRSSSENNINGIKKASSLSVVGSFVAKTKLTKGNVTLNSISFSRTRKENQCSTLVSTEDIPQKLDINNVTVHAKSPETASMKRARYRRTKDHLFSRTKDESRDKYIEDLENRRNFLSLSASSIGSFNTPRLLERRSTMSSLKGSSSIPISLGLRFSKPRNSCASIVLYAKEILQEIKHTRVIAYIFLINFLCWAPLIFLNLVDSIGERRLITYPLIILSQFMFLLNSLLMPFVYAFCKHDFKLALKRWLKNFFRRR